MRGLLQQAVEREETRVAGVGVGTFLLLTFFVISVLIFIVGLASARPVAGVCVSVTTFAVVAILLFAAERESRYVQTEEQNKDYNSLALARHFLVFLMGLCTCLSCVGYCVNHLYKPTYVPIVEDDPRALQRRRAF